MEFSDNEIVISDVRGQQNLIIAKEISSIRNPNEVVIEDDADRDDDDRDILD